MTMTYIAHYRNQGNVRQVMESKRERAKETEKSVSKEDRRRAVCVCVYTCVCTRVCPCLSSIRVSASE